LSGKTENLDIESARHFHEELSEYFPFPDEYYESWVGAVDETAETPSIAYDMVDLDAGIAKDVVETIQDYWTSEEVKAYAQPDYFEETNDVEDETSELTEPPEGSIFGAAVEAEDFPRFPPPPGGGKLPLPPKFPGRPNIPHPPEHKRPPPGKPHWPGHRPKGPNPHFKYINHTIYEFLANSTHHKILYKLVKNDSSLVDLFNKTSKDGKLTLFAPTDCAFKKILNHLPKNHTHAPKWLIKKVLEYHTLGSFYPAGRLALHRTLSTLFEAHHGPNLTQRIRISHNLKGLSINFYAHPVFPNIFTANGVVHAIDNLLLPPPPSYLILQIFPTMYSTFFQALHQTGVAKMFFPWHKSSSSWTIFVPTNIAWVKIPLGVTAWLFSPRGHRILTKLVEYHISPNHTFYTDSLWKFPHPPHHPAEIDGTEDPDTETLPHRPHWKKEHYNTTLPTLIDSKNATLRIDEFKFGPFVRIAINGRPGGVVVNDVLGFDGVIQAVDRIVLPPRRKCGHHDHKHHGHERAGEDGERVDDGVPDEEWTIENLKAIFGDD